MCTLIANAINCNKILSGIQCVCTENCFRCELYFYFFLEGSEARGNFRKINCDAAIIFIECRLLQPYSLTL